MELALDLLKTLLQYIYLITISLIKWGSLMIITSMIVNVWDKRN